MERKNNNKKFSDKRKPLTERKQDEKKDSFNKGKKRDEKASSFSKENKDSKPEQGKEYSKYNKGRGAGSDKFSRGRQDHRTAEKKPLNKQAPKDGLIRLNKFISNAGYCSRREADTLISAGMVSVDGVTITELGYKVSPDAKVKVDNHTLKQEIHRYVLLNKPKDVITTCDDPQGRRTVLQLIKGACKERLYPVGRLDRNTTGLLILTNDGDFAKRIAHPSSKVKKLYEVTLNNKLKQEHFSEISKGVWLDDNTFVDVDDLAYVEASKSGNVLGIEIHSGKYHVVKRIFEKFGYEVVKLDRTKIDILTKKDLPRGRWRFLTEGEVQLLQR
jgi:23S rRNA pseudouridine2605 synthase